MTTRLTEQLATLGRNREADTQRVLELEQRLEEARAHAVELEAAQAEHVSAREESTQRVADLEQQLDELRSATSRVVELEATTTLAEVERARLTRARDDAARRSTELAQQLALLNERAVARTGELEAGLASARDQARRAADEAERRNAELERRVAEVQRAAASQDGELAVARSRIAELEASENATLERAREAAAESNAQLEAASEEAYAEDSSHLLFIPGADGYRLLEQKGPPPAPGSTLEVAGDDGTRSRLLVAKVGAAPLPGVRFACAYLVVAA